jgi:hypothetical protein
MRLSTFSALRRDLEQESWENAAHFANITGIVS